MKKIISFAVLMVMACTCAFASSPPNRLKHENVAKREAQPFNAWKKLDLGSKEVWFKSLSEKKPKAESFIVRTKVEVLSTEKKALEKAGFRCRSVIKNIVTGKMLPSALDKVAQLEFVEFIEAAVPLHLKGKK